MARYRWPAEIARKWPARSPASGQHVACASQRPAPRSTLLQNTDSGAPRPTLELCQIAGSACVIRLADACSVRPRTNDLRALDLSARSGVDHRNDALAYRQLRARGETFHLGEGCVVGLRQAHIGMAWQLRRVVACDFQRLPRPGFRMPARPRLVPCDCYDVAEQLRLPEQACVRT
jgi:hypothetical protein